ncbi:GAF domain-containing protein [Nonomuraea sp. NPDC050404]|uniref:helix-turn-helix domain-containing protein n=1 Tax=Nonomuraea sp. NPDC050404 TaxID=3155783 RepID=UPI0033FF6FC0
MPENEPVHARSAALSVVIGAVVDDAGVSPRELSAALDTLGIPDARHVRERLRRARGEHARLRRREHELGALFSSARELAEVRDGGVLLERLVQRAHEILGCDVTYLSEFDGETRELNVRTTVGAYSAEFCHLRVPARCGLASEIAEVRMARWVPRYSEYLADRRVADIDRAVELEGIVSILGVPMVSGQDVLGVLFVATREERSFTPDQIALLSALADHASVVLQTARTLRDLRDSEEEARRTLDRLAGHLAERDRAGAVHEELVEVVLGGGGFGQLVRTLSTALGRGVTVIDAEDRIVASSQPAPSQARSSQSVPSQVRSSQPVPSQVRSSQPPASQSALAQAPSSQVPFSQVPFSQPAAAPGTPVVLSPEVRAAIAAGSASGRCQLLGGDGGSGGGGERAGGGVGAVGAVAVMRAGAEEFGALLLGPGEFELGPVDRRTIERAAQVCSLLELQQQAVANVEGRLLTDLVADILDAQPGRRDDLERRARRFGVVLSRLDTVHLYVVAGDQRARALAAARQQVGAAGLVGLSHGVVVALLDSRCGGLDAHAIRQHLAHRVGGPALAVVPPPAGSPDDLARRFTTALRTSRLLAVVGVDDEVAETDEYLPYASVFDADARSLDSFVTGLIGPVLDYDAERGTELVATLRAFVRCNAGPTRTARALGFHTNTILQRLERLDALLGPAWREDDRFFRISLAVRLHELMNSRAGRANVT